MKSVRQYGATLAGGCALHHHAGHVAARGREEIDADAVAIAIGVADDAGDDVHVAALGVQLGVQGQAEGAHVALGARVDGGVRQAHVGERAGVDDEAGVLGAAGVLLQHGQQRVGEVRHEGCVDVQHGADVLRRLLVERLEALGGVAGTHVVHQDPDVERLELGDGRAGLGEGVGIECRAGVQEQCFDLDAMFGSQGLGKLIKTALISPVDDEIEAAAAELVSDIPADSRRGTSEDGPCRAERVPAVPWVH